MRKTLYLFTLLAMASFMAAAAPFRTITPVTDSTAAATGAASLLPTLNDALALFDELDKDNNLIDNITPESLVKLPVGESRTLNNVQYTVGITQVKFNPNYAEFTAFLRIKIPQKNTTGKVKDLFFGAYGVKLSRTGGLIGDVKLSLLGDFPIDLGGGKSTLILKGAFDKDNNMVNNGEPVTYASIDCKGFKELSIAADVLFSRDILIPVDGGGQPMPTGQVKGSFRTIASDWNDIMVNLSLPAFQVNGLKDFNFTINQAVFDFSDLRNDPATVFPASYVQDYMPPGSPNVWRGVSISTLHIDLPGIFKKGDKAQPITIEGKNILIDNQGFTGLVSANNLVPIGEGSAGSWPFSIDKFSLELVANNLKGAGFGGRIKLPVDDKTELVYDALISPANEYLLTVKPKDSIQFGFLRASQVTLYRNSSVELRVKDGKFLPKATLNGKMTINATLKQDAPIDDDGVGKLADIEFQGLELQTVSPKIKIASFGYDGTISLGNFPASINNIEVAASNDEVRLGFGIDVHLSGEEDGGFRGDANLDIIGKLDSGKGLESWKFSKIRLNEIGVSFDNSGIALDGHIYIFEDDPTYGKGFAGDLSMTLKKLSLTVTAKAVFGRLPDYRYWYADAFAQLGMAGIPIFPGFKINGIGGGAYQHMKLGGRAPAGTSGIGVTPTGFLYVPDNQVSFGFKASVGFATTSEKVVNGMATLEMAFSTGGGLRYIHFDGTAKFIKDLPLDQFNKLAKNMEKLGFSDEEGKNQYESERKAMGNDAAITAVASLDIDFVNSSLHGVFEVYLSAGPLRGVGAGDLAGSCVMHFDPEIWYIHIGRPDNRIGIKFGLGPINIQTGAYLMVGKEIPGSPPPPAIVASILGVEAGELDYMRDLNALDKGSGFAFGADFSLSTGDLTFLIFYAKFDAGFGFDIMLKDYGEDVHCKGSNEPIGINGWYANGQAYGYFQGDIGLKIKLFFKTKKISILKVGAAVLVQAKLPNPFWMRGYVGGYYSVLGGLVKGRVNFKVTMGQECELVGGSPLDGIKVISDLTPKEQSTEVDVFEAPQAVFNMAVEKEIELDDDAGNPKKYRVKLEKFEMNNNGANISGQLKWNDGKDAVAFYSDEILPPHATIKALVQVSFEELVGSSWRPVMDNGQRALESKEVSFTTGEAPESIPMSNVQYTYPVVDQEHFFPTESNQGYIQLRRGQSYLFDKSAGWQQELHFKAANGQITNPGFSYDAANKQLVWSSPALTNQAKYTLEIVNLPPAGSTPQQVTQGYTAANTGDTQAEGGETDIRDNKASGALTNTATGEKMILTYNFSTSQYNSFAQKMSAVSITKVIREPIFLPDVHALQTFINTIEVFDEKELTGSEFSDGQPLIKGEAVLDGEPYFEQDIKPLIYSNYPYNGMVNLPRESNQSLIPSWAILPIETYLLYPDGGRLPYRYHLPNQYKTDLVEIQTQLVSKAIYTPLPAQYKPLLNAIFPVIRQGTYKMKLTYMLPGQKPGTSTVISMYNPIQ
ncbi:hypothetical protein F0L74_11005 [Chitinophaga agrisoli]|uniref:Uncharacterized protein n=1 Tax=Chitinophaga agrisoli TaxID=2607653 RepID=A0A5B2VWL3_9BACT|nr:hypothetical protein [Chitinophaga agrisoli]KAA2243040.1 hypothetical protein F0L74_11005 [Chitinophaga agrisoli]